jgi:alanine racemase
MHVDRLGTKWMEVDLSQFAENLRGIIQHVSPSKVMPVIKADAYGHGAIELARCCEEVGIESVAVATLEEALVLRRAFIKLSILLLGAVPTSLIADMINYRITPTVCDASFAQCLNEQAKEMGVVQNVQVYVDTGMGRMGSDPEGVISWFSKWESWTHLKCEGVYSHLAVSDEWTQTHVDFTEQQRQRFSDFCEQISLPKSTLRHLGNSGAVISLPQTWYDAVRPGLLSYGISPREDQASVTGVRPIMKLCCRPLIIKAMKAGDSVGYGRAHVLSADSNIMTLPVGYADGIPRSLGPKLWVGFEGRRYPVVGRVCMDMLMVDLGLETCSLDTEVVLLGEGGMSIYEWSEGCDRIPYEILTGLGRRWTRCYLKAGQVVEIVRHG